MARKKWTPQTEVTEVLLKSREKRKWQLSYRRYVLERKPSQSYARYFGLDIETLRNWFELQFTPGLDWDNYAKAWQFDHIVPTHYFDFEDENELMLCWNFINMRVENLDSNLDCKVDILSAEPYFQDLYGKTGYSMAQKMVDKLSSLGETDSTCTPAISGFINQNNTDLENIISFNTDEFDKYNQGIPIADILLEREILKKFG